MQGISVARCEFDDGAAPGSPGQPRAAWGRPQRADGHSQRHGTPWQAAAGPVVQVFCGRLPAPPWTEGVAGGQNPQRRG